MSMVVRCRSCGGSAKLAFRTKDRNRRITDEEFSYYRCSVCGIFFLGSVPDNLGDYYPEDYYGALPVSVQALEAAALKHEGYKIDLVKKVAHRGRLLEIGPSMGGFALLARAAGYEVEAIEMDQRCCRFLNEIAAIKTIHAEDELAALERVERAADVIALWQVIEHLRNPLELIRAVSRKLRPGGGMVIAAPNPDSVQFRLFRGAWTHVDAPRHLCLIPLSLLRQELEALAMEIVLETTTDPGSLGWNEFGWKYSLSNFCSQPRPKQLAQAFGAWITHMIKPFEEAGHRGSTYTVIARKA